MTSRFADSAYYVALLLEDDSQHEKAVSLTSAFTGQILTTQWVLAELAGFMSREGWREKFIHFIAQLRRHPALTIVEASPEQFDQALALYSQRQDKEWSLVDCISFNAMRERGLTDALTTDHHFEQAGFNVLLKP